MKGFVLRLPVVMLPLWVSVESFLSAIEASSTIQESLRSCDFYTYNVQREELLACGSAMYLRHLSVALLIEFADADTAQKAHYQLMTNSIVGGSLILCTPMI